LKVRERPLVNPLAVRGNRHEMSTVSFTVTFPTEAGFIGRECNAPNWISWNNVLISWLINQWYVVANKRARNRKLLIYWLLRPKSLQLAAVSPLIHLSRNQDTYHRVEFTNNLRK
jgi:hypothetical protein